ncbi:hypothetical protein CANMA_002418 [Candida margitis]|uniref:uncharacterized protein n=1 Tax=Candida margitis TaxID=1775924 RepID=UPI002226A24D|nr:uncharacterized protein CANMA_002418 [Candida margitis]KAI5968202.1 hypothetical protein CANMA_002418 [Candida margitis]
MSVPLYLKVKGPTSTSDQYHQPCFAVTSEKSIEFNDTNYDFEQIYQASETQYPELINSSHNSCIVLMGPTGGGKTTMLKHLISAKLKTFDDNEPVFVSSFEITNNKFLIDLLDSNDTSRKVPFSLLNNFENKLKRKKASAELIKEVLKQRSSKATEFNANSSRSCLVITFFYHNFRTTFVDLMGSEKNSKFSSNIFANTNISSITQQMVNKQKDVRSHNLVTNYIFKNKDLKVVLNLDPNGDVSLIKSTLTNIADIVKTFKLETVENTVRTRRTPSYTMPTMSSIRGSPQKLAKRVGVTVKPTPSVKPIPRVTASMDRKYSVRKPPVPTRSPSKDAKLIEALKMEQSLSKQKYAESISEIKTEIGYFKQETNQMLETFQNLRSKLDLLSQANEEKQQQIVAAKGENDKIVEELDHFKQKVVDYQQNKSGNEEEIARLEAELNRLEQELSVSRNAVSELESFKTNLENKIELSKQEEQKLMDRIRVLNLELDENKKLMASKTYDINQLQETIESQNASSVEKENEISELLNAKDELAKRNEALTSELENLKLSFEKSTVGNNEAQDAVTKLSALVAEKESEIERLHDVEEKLNHLKESHQNESEWATSEMSKLKADMAAKQIKIDHLNSLEASLNQQVEQLQNEKQVLESKVNELAQSNKELQLQIDSGANVNNGRIAELEARLLEKNNHANGLSQELQTETSLKSQLKSDLEAAILKYQTLQSEFATLESNLSNHSNENEDLTNKLTSKTQQLKTKIETITQLEKSVHDSNEQYKLLQDRFTKKQDHYKTKISDLKKAYEVTIAEKDAEIKRLKSSPTKLGLSDDYNGHLFSERSSPFGFNPNDIYQDSVVESTVNFNHGGKNTHLSHELNKPSSSSSDHKSSHNKKSPNKKFHDNKKSPEKEFKQKSRSSTPNKHTPTKNVLQSSFQANSAPLSSGGKIKKKSGSNKSSPLKSIKT